MRMALAFRLSEDDGVLGSLGEGCSRKTGQDGGTGIDMTSRERLLNISFQLVEPFGGPGVGFRTLASNWVTLGVPPSFQCALWTRERRDTGRLFSRPAPRLMRNGQTLTMFLWCAIFNLISLLRSLSMSRFSRGSSLCCRAIVWGLTLSDVLARGWTGAGV